MHLDFRVSEAEGPAPLHPRVITKPFGSWVLLKSSGADPSPSYPITQKTAA